MGKYMDSLGKTPDDASIALNVRTYLYNKLAWIRLYHTKSMEFIFHKFNMKHCSWYVGIFE